LASLELVKRDRTFIELLLATGAVCAGLSGHDTVAVTSELLRNCFDGSLVSHQSIFVNLTSLGRSQVGPRVISRGSRLLRLLPFQSRATGFEGGLAGNDCKASSLELGIGALHVDEAMHLHHAVNGSLDTFTLAEPGLEGALLGKCDEHVFPEVGVFGAV